MYLVDGVSTSPDFLNDFLYFCVCLGKAFLLGGAEMLPPIWFNTTCGGKDSFRDLASRMNHVASIHNILLL
jgi:hypothetical protein